MARHNPEEEKKSIPAQDKVNQEEPVDNSSPTYANYPRPWFVSILSLHLLSLCSRRCRRGDTSFKGKPIIDSKGRPGKLWLMWRAMCQAVIFAIITAGLLMWLDVKDWAIRAIAVLVIYGLAGVLLAYCWDLARKAYWPIMTMLARVIRRLGGSLWIFTLLH
jgi:hypothetical protein